MTEKQIESMPEPSSWAQWKLMEILSKVRMETNK